jgi:carboxyl-terminal processing protease
MTSQSRNKGNILRMKLTRYTLLTLVGVIIFYGFKTGTDSGKFQKLKTLFQLSRLINENYVEEPDMDDVLEGAIIGMLDRLDPHSTYISGEHFEKVQEQFAGKFEGIGVEFSILDGYITVISPIPGTPSERAGLASGDKFTKINGKSAYKITQEEVFEKLRGPKGSEVIITIAREGEAQFDVLLIRDEIPIVSVLAAFMTDDKTGYIKLNRFASTSAEEIWNSLKTLESQGMEQLVLDLRNNGGGLMDQAVEIIDMFVSSNDTIVFTKGRLRNSNSALRAHKQRTDRKYPIITLINRGSASASEIVSGAFQDLDRGLVVGETSFGKGLVQRQYPLNDGSAARVTIARYYTPSGRLIQRPYEDGLDEYYAELGETDREANDSTLTDKPEFKTKKGRTVFGGGGITPDIYVVNDREYSKSTLAVFNRSKRHVFNYANLIKSTISSKFSNYDDFSEFHLNTESQLKFINWLKEQEIEFVDEEILQDWDFIENRILSDVASALWGKEYIYHKSLEIDIQFQEAMKHFEEANNLLN